MMAVGVRVDPTMNGGAWHQHSIPPPEGGGREDSFQKLEYQRPATSDQPPDERHTNGRKVRADALPEYLEYRDAGCDLAPSCLRCPLVRCRYDEPGGARRLLQSSRDEAVRHRREEGAGIETLAAEFRISRRSVFRILARGRARRSGS